MPTPEQVIAGYGAAVTQVRARVLAFAKAAWSAQGSYRDADVEALVAMILPRVQAGQVQVANLTAAYIAQVASLRTGTTVAPAMVDKVAVTSGRGVPAAEVYRRPFVEVWTSLAKGATFPDAVQRGSVRLESLVATDVQMAKVRQSQASMGASGAKYFRRTLTGADNCALCVLASTLRYRVENLLPIHARCNCGVDPLPGDADLVLEPDVVEQVHEAIADLGGDVDRSARTADYRSQRLIAVQEHGEHGPVLTWRGQDFTGPADL